MRSVFGSQQLGQQNGQAQRETMQENLMPLLNSFDWQSAFGFSKPQENTNSNSRGEFINAVGLNHFLLDILGLETA